MLSKILSLTFQKVTPIGINYANGSDDDDGDDGDDDDDDDDEAEEEGTTVMRMMSTLGQREL